MTTEQEMAAVGQRRLPSGHIARSQSRLAREPFTITGAGTKAAYGCTGPYPMPCWEAFPVSRFAWCSMCLRYTP